MIKKIRSINREQAIYFLIFILAMIVRLVNLTKLPLSDFEAEKALQSWNIVQGHGITHVSNPAYFSLTAFLFYIFGSSNLLARLWPAIIGSLLVLTPYGFREYLGRKTSLILTIGFALDPGLVSLSRLAGSPIMAIGFTLLCFTFISNSSPLWAGIFGGLALSSGSSIFFGFVGFFVPFLISKKMDLIPESIFPRSKNSINQENHQGKYFFVTFTATIILVCTLFFSIPIGMGAWGNSISDFLLSWIHPSGIPAFQPFLALVFYQPLAIFLSIVTIIKGIVQRERKYLWISFWAIFIICLSFIQPGRMVFDSAWALVPIWTLAAVVASHYLVNQTPKIAFIIEIGFVFVLVLLFLQTSLKFESGNTTWLVMVMVPLLILLATAMVGIGWSWDVAFGGLSRSLILLFSIYLVAIMLKSSIVQTNNVGNLWITVPQAGQIEQINKSVQELSLLDNGRVDSIHIVSLVNSPSLEWALRKFPYTYVSNQLEPRTQTSVIITPEDGSDLSQSMPYRGQDFSLSEYPGWTGALPPWNQLWRWIIFRESSVSRERVVLWARADLFPDAPEENSEISNNNNIDQSDYPLGGGPLK